MTEKVVVTAKPPLFVEHPFRGGECGGCQYPIISRIIAEVVAELGIEGRTIIVTTSACGLFTWMTYNVDCVWPNHGMGIDVAAAIKHVLPDAIVLNYAGDGDVAAIGAGAFISSVARADKITCVMINNGHYAMTGGQLAPTTIMGQVTTTTPWGRGPDTGYTLHIPELIAPVKGVAYAARGSATSPANYQRTKRYIKAALQSQMDGLGFSFVEFVSACPVGWRMTPEEALTYIDEKITSELPLGEFKNLGKGE